jgi:hypothetical protein
VSTGETAPSAGGSRLVGIAFVGGILTAGAIALAFFVFLGIRIGFATIWERTGVSLTGMVLDMPSELVDELAAMDAVIENAGNPTGAREHDTILVRTDDELGYVLQPNASVDAYQIRAADSVNLDPPVVCVKAGSEMSEALRAYLEERTRVRYSYNVDENGFRRTLPEVDAEEKILMVGDSGIFGMGVDDEDTIASSLQRLVGDSYRVVNAGIAGYDGDQAFRAARKLSETDDYEILVYVAHNNDFDEPRHIPNPVKARRVITSFESLTGRFPGGIVVALITYLEYTGEDVLLSQGWRRERIEAADRLHSEFPAITEQAGFAFVDWTDIVAETRAQEKTIFAPWSLYVDHAHLAPRASRLIAERIYRALPERRSNRRGDG